ncbi:MAG: sodium/proline symporter [Candidatus Krumholzibacteriota bacterium]|nr:sodium/proline symporter [Candidatus Krumholzibacteriota bacterium]
MSEIAAGWRAFTDLLRDPQALGFLGYLAVVLVIGAATARSNRRPQDYFLAGRRLGGWVAAISERASGESAWLLIGLPGLFFVDGFGALWVAVGCALGILFSWLFIAPRLRASTAADGSLTIPDYLENRFGDGHHSLRLVATLVILFFYTLYVSAQVVAAGKVLETAFGMPVEAGMALGVGIIVLYTLLGGFLAVAITDVVQGLLMVAALVLLPVVGLISLGGFEPLGEAIAAVDPDLLRVSAGRGGRALWMGLVIGSLGIGLGYMGQPHLLTRFMAVRSARQLRRGTGVALVWTSLSFWGAILVGAVGLALLQQGGLPGLPAGAALDDRERIMPLVAQALLHPWLAGVLISAAIAAMMSTADSQLLVATSAMAEDLCHKLLGWELPSRTMVGLSRVTTLMLGLLAFLLALYAKETVFHLVLYAWAGLGAVFGPVLLLGLWWRNCTRAGALAGMLTGLAVMLVWARTPVLKGLVYELVPAFLAALFATLLVSRLSRRGV